MLSSLTLGRLAPLLAGLLFCGPVRAQTFDQITRPAAALTRPAQIDSFLTELLIPPPDTVTTVLIVDITANGYGPDDMVIIFPAQLVYPLGERIPPSLQVLMQAWELEADYRLDATLAETRRVEADAHLARDARAAISGVCLNAIARYYDAQDLDMRLTRRAEGLRLEMWNLDPGALRYNPPPPDACLQARTQEWAQRFRFARPYLVTSFNQPGDCVETRHVDGRLETRPCQ